MSKKAIEYLTEYKLDKESLSFLTDDQMAALSVISFAVSEVNALMRIYLFAANELTDNPVIDTAISIQRNVLMRTWSAKIFEFKQFLDTGNKHNKTDDVVVLKLAAEARKSFEPLEKMDGFKITRILRNEATNHYKLRPTRENLNHVSESSDFSMYVHKTKGNSFYPMGEEVVFLGRINRYGKDILTKEEKIELTRDWVDWNLAAVKWLNEVHLLFVTELVFKNLREKSGYSKVHWIDPILVGSAGQSYVPLFLRTEP